MDAAMAHAARYRAQHAYQSLLRDAELTAQRQEQVLMRRLAIHGDSEFGKAHQFHRIRNYEDFREAVPVRDYEQLRPFVAQVIEGNERALLGRGQRVVMFAMTSGSTDRPKYIPVTDEFIRDYRRGWHAFGGKALLDHPDAFLRGILQVASSAEAEHTPKGVPCGAISGLLAKAQSSIVQRYYAAPPEAADISDADARYYTIMRFAVPRDVGWVVTASPATPLKLAQTAARHADRLIRDVHDGTLTPPVSIPKTAGARLMSRLRPDPEAANELEACLARTGRLLPRDYWNLSFIANWKGGTLGLHLADFEEYFGPIPVREIGLLATEGRISIGLDNHGAAGLMDVHGCFLEFVEWNGGTAGAVRLGHELDIGGTYSVIITNSAGLFRYDLGDCVRVTGMVGRAPMLEFLHRGRRVSSVAGEKITEWQVTKAMERCAASLGVRISQFAVAPAWGDPPYYRLYVAMPDARAKKLAARFDQELQALNMEYAAKRSSGRLGLIHEHAMKCQGFGLWDQRCHERRQAGEQYKHQYLFTEPEQDAELRALAGVPDHDLSNCQRESEATRSPGESRSPLRAGKSFS